MGHEVRGMWVSDRGFHFLQGFENKWQACALDGRGFCRVLVECCTSVSKLLTLKVVPLRALSGFGY